MTPVVTVSHSEVKNVQKKPFAANMFLYAEKMFHFLANSWYVWCIRSFFFAFVDLWVNLLKFHMLICCFPLLPCSLQSFSHRALKTTPKTVQYYTQVSHLKSLLTCNASFGKQKEQTTEFQSLINKAWLVKRSCKHIITSYSIMQTLTGMQVAVNRNPLKWLGLNSIYLQKTKLQFICKLDVYFTFWV